MMIGLTQRVKPYKLALMLGIGGLGFLAVGGSITKATLGAAGFLLLGAAVARWVDTRQQQRSARAQAAEQRRRALDETRRLLLMIRMSLAEPSPELVATVVNALVYQHGMDLPEEQLMFRLMRAGRNANEDQKRWMQELIAEVSGRRNAVQAERARRRHGGTSCVGCLLARPAGASAQAVPPTDLAIHRA